MDNTHTKLVAPLSAVDVLAVLRRHVALAEEVASPDQIAEARGVLAVVAELIAQRDMMANALVTYRKAGVGNSTDFYLQMEASTLAAVALARVGGAK